VCAGIDENGLGPRLGPLVVTGVVARARDEQALRVAESKPRRGLSARLGDSKALVGHGDTALGEAWARAVAMRAGIPFGSPDELVHALAIEPREALRLRCPDGHVDQCWGARGEQFVAEDKLVTAVAKDLDKLEKAGVEVVRADLSVVCTERINDAVARGLSRFHVDLHAMERLALTFVRRHGEARVTCGKVGGFDRYGPAFGPLAGHLHTVLEEGRARSAYRVLGVGEIAFVRDADASHLLVCMASLIGKWVRDLLMGRVVRYYRASDPELPIASGYHDPVTARFVKATALVRATRGVPTVCFERTRISLDAEAPAEASAASASPTPNAAP
jgi:ribonuclease HII